MAEKTSESLTDKLPLSDLMDSTVKYGKSLVGSGIRKASEKVEGMTGKLTDFASGESSGVAGNAAKGGAEAAAKGENPAKGAIGGALSGVKDKIKDAFTGGGGSGSKNQKLVNIVEEIDVGVPVTVAYNQWTEFNDWSDFMKKVENSEHEEDEGTVHFKGQVFLSHRQWDATIKEMVPDDRIVWKSTGQKGHLDGAVTFHPLAPRLTRIIAVVEYYPQGLFEKTGQIWRAVGRRVRVELKRYVRHTMTTTILDPDSVEGWRGEIRDEEIVRTHDEVVEQEQAEREDQENEPDESEQDSDADQDSDTDQAGDDEYDDEPADDEEEPADDEEQPEDEYEEDEGEYADDEEEPADDEPADDEPADDEPADDEPADDEYEDEDDSEDAEEPADEEDEYDDVDDEEPARR